MNVTATDSGSGTGSTVTIDDENGAQVVYTENADGTYSGPSGTRSNLATMVAPGWTLTRQNQDVLTFNAFGEPLRRVDRNGVGLTLSYNGSGQLCERDRLSPDAPSAFPTTVLVCWLQCPCRSKPHRHLRLRLVKRSADYGDRRRRWSHLLYLHRLASSPQSPTRTDTRSYPNVPCGRDESSLRSTPLVEPLPSPTTPPLNTTTYTDPDGNQWQDVYQNGVLVERIDPLGDTTSYSYDANLDRIPAVTDPNWSSPPR